MFEVEWGHLKLSHHSIEELSAYDSLRECKTNVNNMFIKLIEETVKMQNINLLSKYTQSIEELNYFSSDSECAVSEDVCEQKLVIIDKSVEIPVNPSTSKENISKTITQSTHESNDDSLTSTIISLIESQRMENEFNNVLLNVKDKSNIEQIFKNIWMTFLELEERKLFIICVKKFGYNMLDMWQNILYPWFLDQKDLDQALETLKNVVPLLQNDLFEGFMVPLLNFKKYIFIQKITIYEGFFILLEEFEKLELIRLFLKTMEMEVQDDDFKVLYSFLSYTDLDTTTAVQLVEFLNLHILALRNNRQIGLILVKLLEKLSSYSSVKSDILKMCKIYTGTPRFRISKLIKALK